MTEDEALNEVVRLWKEADGHSDMAQYLSDQSSNEQHQANELEDKAEEIWRPIAEAHPEWFDALRTGEDPRKVTP